MATILPARRFYEIEYEYGLWWEQGVGGAIYPDSDILLVSSEGDLATPTEFARTAIQFKTDTPAWASVGDLTETNAVLWVYLDNYAHRGGIAQLLIGNISGAWNMASSQATMRTLGVTSWTLPLAPNPNQEHGWVGFVLDKTSSHLKGANGIMMKINTSFSTPASFKFMREPAPTGRAYLSIDIDNAISGSAAERAVIDSKYLSALEDSSGFYDMGATILQEPIFPSRDNIEITLGGETKTALLNRSTPFPETWKIETPSLGALSFSKAEENLHDFQGTLVELILSMRIGQKAPIDLMTQQAILGEVQREENSQEVEVADPLYEAMQMTPYLRDPILGMEGVNLLDEPRPYALLEILVNGAGLAWDRIRQEDFYWLLLRFGTIWDKVTYTANDLEAHTVGSFLEEIGVQFALAYSRGSDDAFVVWHPAVYRPSLRVYEINDDDLNDIVYKKTAQDKYDIVKINTTPVGSSAPLSTRIDSRDKTKTIDGLTGCFSSYPAARYSLGKQLAQRLIGDYETYEFTVGTRASAWENGDKLKITSEENDFTDRVFTLIDAKGNSETGVYKCLAVHWPDSPAYQSTWQNTGLMGIWRMWAWDTWDETGANQSPIGSAGAMTITEYRDILNLDWRGVVGQADLVAPATFAPDSGGGSSKYDLVDFTLTIIGEQASDPTGGGGDPDWTNILRFEDSGNRKAVYCGIKRTSSDDGHLGTYYSPCDQRIFLGYTPDKAANPLTWNSKVESPPGFANDDHEWTYGIAIQWHDETVRLYVDRILIGEISVASYNFDTVYFVTPIGTEHMIGCIRWLQQSSGWFSADQCVGSMGQDNFYP